MVVAWAHASQCCAQPISSLRDYLFGSHSADPHFAAAPPVARYDAETGIEFVLDRQASAHESGLALLKFDNSAEIWALTPTRGPRGDVIFKNDVGEPVLRASRLGGLTLFTPGRPGGVAVSVAGPTGPLRPVTSIGPEALIRALKLASARASRSAQHLVIFDAPDVKPDSDWVFADAAWLAAEAFARMAGRGPPGRTLVARYEEVVLTPGRSAGVQVTGGTVQVVVAPDRGFAGRPSSERILAAMDR